MTQTWDDVGPQVATSDEVVERSAAALAPLPLRLMLGFGLMYHGFPKLFSVAGHEGFVAMLAGLGVPAPELMAWAVGIFEVFGGLMLIVGLLVVPVAVIGIIHQIFAALLVHLPAGFNFLNVIEQRPDGAVYGVPGYEVNLLYIAGLAALAIGGAGAWSIDRAVWRKRTDVPGHVGMRQPSE